MMISITMDSAGRVVLPSDARRQLNLGPGARLTLAVVAGRIELTPEPHAEPATVKSAGGREVLAPGGKALDAASLVRSERALQAGRRRGR